MGAKVIDGKAFAATVRAQVAAHVARLKEEKGITPECIVMLTDGYISEWGDEWNAPILWTICNGASDVFAPCGKTVHIKD